jgi:hypothetical protein
VAWTLGGVELSIMREMFRLNVAHDGWWRTLGARIFFAGLAPGDVDKGVLTQCQRDAAAGIYVKLMSGYTAWLAPQLDKVRADFRKLFEEYRAKAANDFLTTSMRRTRGVLFS